MYVRFYASLSSFPCRLLVIICVDRNCVQHMRLQAMGSNSLSGSIICLSICPSVRLFVQLSSRPRYFFDFCICINFQCGGPASWCVYPHTGVRRNLVGSSQYSISVRPSISMYICTFLRVAFRWSNNAACNCALRMRPKATFLNPLSGSKICPSICPSGCPRNFYDFCICINFQCGVLALRCIYSQPGGFINWYVSK